MRRVIITFFSFLLILSPVVLQAAEVKNVVARPVGNRVLFEYDLTGDEREAEVSVTITIKGQTYSTDKLHLEGDVGKVRTGSGKRIWWNVLQDFPKGMATVMNWEITASKKYRQITDTGNNVSPAWSLDGKRIAFQRDNNIWTIFIDGSDALRLTNMPSPRFAWGPVYRPNSNELYYMDNSPSGLDFHWIIKTLANGKGGRNEVLMVPGGETFSPISFSPDGNMFCHVYFKRNKKGDLKIANANGGNHRAVLVDEDITGRCFWGTGKNSIHLAYSKLSNGILSIYTTGTKGEGEKRATDERLGDCTLTGWSADGEAIIFTRQSDRQIYILHTGNGSLQRITNDEFPNDGGTISPDNSLVVFFSKKSGNNHNIFIVPLSGKESGSPSSRISN